MVAHSSSVQVIARLNPNQVPPDACGEVTGCDSGHQEVVKCSTRGGPQGMYIMFTSTKQLNKAEPTLALKPRNPNRGTNDPKIEHMCPPKTFEKRKRNLPHDIDMTEKTREQICNNPIQTHGKLNLNMNCFKSPVIHADIVCFDEKNITLSQGSKPPFSSYTRVNRLCIQCVVGVYPGGCDLLLLCIQ